MEGKERRKNLEVYEKRETPNRVEVEVKQTKNTTEENQQQVETTGSS